MNGPMFSTSPDDIRTTNGHLLTPIYNSNASRKASDSQELSTTNGDPLSGDKDVGSSPNIDSGQWSSAVGHATTGGKSGRVIEKLMAENDRLKRELKEQLVKAEEMQKNADNFKPRFEALQAENGNLSHARGVDAALLSRRERIITDLRAELKQEKDSRKAYQSMSQKLMSERDEAVKDKDREAEQSTDKLQQAQTEYDVLQQMYNKQQQLYKRQFEAAKKGLDGLQEEKEADRQRLSRLEIVSNQMRQEVERTQTLQEQIVKKWEELGIEKKQRFEKLAQESSAETERFRKFSDEMEAVVGEMKWVMAVKKNTRLDEDDQKRPRT